MHEHDSLRKALTWLLQQSRPTPRLIAEASRHFDLSPRDEEFLRQYFLADEVRGQPVKNDQDDDLESS